MSATLKSPIVPETKTTSNPNLRTSGSGYVNLSVDSISAGTSLRHPIYDTKGLLLVKSGIAITQSMLDKLHARNINFVLAHTADAEVIKKTQATINVVRIPVPQQQSSITPPRIQSSLSKQKFERASAAVAESILQTQDLHRSLLKAKTIHIEQPLEVVNESWKRILEDQDLTLHANFYPLKPSYPAGQGTSTATLAMSMGLALGLQAQQIQDLGSGCLLHDSGMLKMDRDLVLSPNKFGEQDHHRIARHVLASEQMVNQIRHVSNDCVMVARQIHERVDGRGYPSHLSGRQFHPLARIASVADCFVGMISPRLYRAANHPYHAMEYMLKETSKGRFDPRCMRALLQVVSLFPIGTIVKLDDGRSGKVLRANPANYCRPIIGVISTSEGPQSETVVDLNLDQQISISGIVEPAPLF